MKKEAEIKISAREANGFLFEKYEYSPGTVAPLPAHTHSEYQFSMSPNTGGEYLCRGGRFSFAALTLGIIHSGEKHAPSDKLTVEEQELYCVMYVAPEEIMKAAAEIGWRSPELPYFKDFRLFDKNLVTKYFRLFAGNSFETTLSEDIKKLDFLTFLIENFAQNKNTKTENKPHPICVIRAREFLDANFTNDISLDDLAAIAGVGKFYLCREFRRIIGISPHLYQNHLRINFARKLLLKNKTATEVAHELGFYDQSHFGKAFKRLVGITPQSYAASAMFS